MHPSDLYNKLKKEDTDETTTSDAIAFSPQMMSPPIKPAPMIQTKKKRKKLGGVLMEDINNQVELVQKDILVEFNKIIADSDLTIDLFVQHFGIKNNITPNNVLARYGYNLDLARLKDALPEELGENEMILEALQNKQTLARFKYTNEFPYLYGAKIKSVLNGVTLIYDGYIESGYNRFEQITIQDDDVIEYAEDGLSNVKIDKNVIFPLNGRFDEQFYKELEDVVLSYDEEVPDGRRN
jgi:hypothetical protein